MRRALQLAARGQGWVEPNPMVGCVIVRGGQVLGEGYHRRFVGPHAEIEALRNCQRKSKSPRRHGLRDTGAVLPSGKTPPCTAALIEAGVAVWSRRAIRTRSFRAAACVR